MDRNRLISRLAVTAIVVLVVAVVLLVLFRGFSLWHLFLSVTFGALVSGGNCWLLSRDISRARYADPEKVEGWLLARFLMRYLLIGLGFLACLLYPQLNMVGYVLGFVAFQLILFWLMFHFWA